MICGAGKDGFPAPQIISLFREQSFFQKGVFPAKPFCNSPESFPIKDFYASVMLYASDLLSSFSILMM